MFDNLTNILDLGMFSDLEKQIMNENKVEFNKQINDFMKTSRAASKLSYCYYCGREIGSFCNSHTVPAFCLRNIAVNGKVSTLNSIIDFPLLNNDKGVAQAGTFQLICRDCDSKIFSDYENPYNYDELPTQKMLAQISLKNNLKFISKRRIEKEFFTCMLEKNNMIQNFADAKHFVQELDLNEYINAFNKAKKALEKGWDEYYLCYYEKLNYTVPIAFQGCISIAVDFDGSIINDIYNQSPKYILKPIHICIFPFEASSIIMMFIENGDKRYRNFYKTFSKLELSDKLLTLLYIILAYSEDFYISPRIYDVATKNEEVVRISQKGQDIFSLTPYFDPYALLKKQFDLEERKKLPNFLLEEYRMDKE